MTQLKIIAASEINSAREAYQKMNNEKQIADFRAMAARFIEKYIIKNEDSAFAVCTAGYWGQVDIKVSDSAAKIALEEFRAAGYKTYLKTDNSRWFTDSNTNLKAFIISIRPFKDYSRKTFWREIALTEIK